MAQLRDLGLQYPPSDDDGDTSPVPVRHARPSLRVTTVGTGHMLQPQTDTPPASTLTECPDTPGVQTPPSSAISSDSPAMSAGDLVSPLRDLRAQSVPPPALHPPLRLPQLPADMAFRIPDAPSYPASNAAELYGRSAEARYRPRTIATRGLSKASSLPTALSSTAGTASSAAGSSRSGLPHPYARIYAKKAEAPTVKRRNMWNHALEKSLFTPDEIATLGAQNRRTIYTASLENHIDELHAQCLELGLYPVPFDALAFYKGLNSKTAKVSAIALLPSAGTDGYFPAEHGCGAAQGRL